MNRLLSDRALTIRGCGPKVAPLDAQTDQPQPPAARADESRVSPPSPQRPAQPPPRLRRLLPWIVLSSLTLPALFALWSLLSTIASPPAPATLRGVWLGMTPDQVRERYERTGEGSFRAQAIGQDLALDWTGESPPPRFEFHAGQLVAVRIVVPREAPESTGDRLTASSQSVISREPRPDGSVAITWLARSCPTHADEVSRLLSHDPAEQR